MTKHIKKFFRSFRKEERREITRSELMVKAARGSMYAIRRHRGALERLAEYDRKK